MKTFRIISLLLCIGGLTAVGATAQTVPIQAQAPGRIYLINTNVFADEKAGITKYIAGNAALVREFTPVQNELQALTDKVQRLAAEIKTLQQQASEGKVKVDVVMAQAKSDEYDRAQREFKFKQEDAKARYDKREVEVLGPIRADIGKAIAEYAKKNGYWMILDASKLGEADVFLAVDENADITKSFVAYYNTRP